MAYTDNEKSTGLDVLTDLTITQSDLHIVGDVSDSGRAKAITQDLLEDYIANSTNFVNELTTNSTFQTAVNNFVTSSSSLDVQENGVSVENPVDTINFVTNGGIVSTPLAGVVDVDLTALLSGGGGTKVAIDYTRYTTSDGNNSYTVAIPGNILSTDNAIRFELPISDIGFTFQGTPITISATYGGTSIGSVNISTLATGFSSGGGGIYKGVLMATGSTNTQKGVVAFTSTVWGNISGQFELENIASATANATVDSTVSQNLVVTITSAGTAATIVTEGIIVEKITSGGSIGDFYNGSEFYFANYSAVGNPTFSSGSLPNGNLWKFNDYLIIETDNYPSPGQTSKGYDVLKIDPTTGNYARITQPWTLSTTPLRIGNMFIDETQSKMYIEYVAVTSSEDLVIDEFDSTFTNTNTYRFTGNIHSMYFGRNLLKIGSAFYSEVQQLLSGTISTLQTYRFDISGSTLINPTATNLPSLQQASWDGTNVWSLGAKYTVSGVTFTPVSATYPTPPPSSAVISGLDVYGIQIIDGKYCIWQPTGSYFNNTVYTGTLNNYTYGEIAQATLRQYPLP